MCGCWMNCVNGIGCPWAPPSNTGVMKVVTGKSGTMAEAMFDSVGARFSADEAAVGGNDRLDRQLHAERERVVLSGRTRSARRSPTTFTFVTKNC